MVRLQPTLGLTTGNTTRYGLNSTMVRLQQAIEELPSISFEKVSIPLWFDYNRCQYLL